MNIVHAWLWFAPPAMPPPNLWECLGGQGVLAGSAGGEYQHILEYNYALIKITLTLESHWFTCQHLHIALQFFSLFNHCLLFLLSQYICYLQMETNVFAREENYTTDVCRWHDTRTPLNVMRGGIRLLDFTIFCKTAEVPYASSTKYLTLTVVVGEGSLYWFIINHSKMRLLCCNIALGRCFLTKLFYVLIHFFSNMILSPHDCLLNYESHDSLTQPVQSYFLYT